jgi:hypothetical protein
MSRPFPILLLRYLVLIGLAFWMGGFTFYAGVVIHVGHRVFGTMRETGFLTQQVTLWLNRSGAIVLAILILNLLLTRRQIAPRWWITAAATLAIMIAVQIALFELHPRLDAFLDASTQIIRERPAFHREHLMYMNLSTAQWTAALIHLWTLLVLWRKSDRAPGLSLPVTKD